MYAFGIGNRFCRIGNRFCGISIGFVGLVIGFRICVMRTVVNRIGFKN